MRNKLMQRTYECKCGVLTKEYVWDNDLQKFKVKCSECSNKLDVRNLLKVTFNQATSIRTPTKNR